MYSALARVATLLIGMVTPKQVGIALFGPYVLGVELASMLPLRVSWALIISQRDTPGAGGHDVQFP